MVRQVYTKEFKIKAIELLESSNKPLRQIELLSNLVYDQISSGGHPV